MRVKVKKGKFIMGESNNFKDFWSKYKGAIIGAIIAILLLCTGLYRLCIAVVVIVVGVFFGNYIQKNKEDVKDNLKNFIDKF